MPLKRRPDGVRVWDIEPYTKIMPYIMKRRSDAQNMFLAEIICDPIDDFIKKERDKGNRITYLHVVMAGLVRLYSQREKMNRFIMNGKIYQRNSIQLSFVVKKALRDDAFDTTITLDFDGTENIYEVAKKIDDAIRENTSNASNDVDKTANMLTKAGPGMIKFVVGLIKFLDKINCLPKSILKVSPFHASCFVTNMKSIKTDYIYHHIYDFGTIGMFVGLGKEAEKPIVKNGEITIGKIMNLGIVMDERFCDGLYYANSFRKFSEVLADPSVLLEKYDRKPIVPMTKQEEKEYNREGRKKRRQVIQQYLKKAAK